MLGAQWSRTLFLNHTARKGYIDERTWPGRSVTYPGVPGALLEGSLRGELQGKL